MKPRKTEIYGSMKGEEIAREMREGIREALASNEQVSRVYFSSHYKNMSVFERHGLKKKFVSRQEAEEWNSDPARTRGDLFKVYKCPVCPFFHLTTKGARHG